MLPRSLLTNITGDGSVLHKIDVCIHYRVLPYHCITASLHYPQSTTDSTRLVPQDFAFYQDGRVPAWRSLE
jgi:hypothetical protein